MCGCVIYTERRGQKEGEKIEEWMNREEVGSWMDESLWQKSVEGENGTKGGRRDV